MRGERDEEGTCSKNSLARDRDGDIQPERDRNKELSFCDVELFEK